MISIMNSVCVCGLIGLGLVGLTVSCAADEAKTAPAPIQISSPMDYQVFQRSSRGEGMVYLNGQINVPSETLEARFVGRSISGRLPGKWFEVARDPGTGKFNLARTLPAGGWYKLEMRATNGSLTVTQASVEHFGVGEVFVTAGQSNSTNCGQFQTKETSGMVSSFSGSNWQIANDPQPGAHDGSQGGSPWPGFGDAMYAKYKVPIAVAVTGHGGTSVNSWKPGDELFNWMMTRIKQLGRNGFRGVLWHQGESDVSMTSDEYYDKLAEVIKASNKQAGWAFPWFVAEVSYCPPNTYPTTRAAQEKLWKDGVALQGPDTDKLIGDNRDYDGGGIHFSPKGLKAHGEMWAVCVGKYLSRILGK